VKSRSTARAVALVDRLARASGVFNLLRNRVAGGVTILMYHKVLPESLVAAYPLRNLVVDSSSFDWQMAWLAKNYQVMTLGDAMAAMDREVIPGNRPMACVTFDDGYLDNALHAAPILEAHGLRGTFFVTTGFVEGSPMWFDRASCAWRNDMRSALARAIELAPEHSGLWNDCTTLDTWMGSLKQLGAGLRNSILDAITSVEAGPDEVFGPMAPSHLRRLSEIGHEIAAHSVTHPILTRLDDDALRVEMTQSRATLQGWTGHPVEGFCYPNGDCDERVVAVAKSAGYRYACSVRRGVATRSSDRMALPRRAVFSSGREPSVEGFEAELVGWHDLLRHTRNRLNRSWNV
jgi:peptidoglycan/xylan/chitin deacetylase (PgdA/CDA1 family)